MKRILFAVPLVCGLLIAASCKKDEPVKEKTYYDFVLEDYTTLATRYPEARDHFVETRFVLNKPISEAGADELKAEAMQTICYAWREGASRIFTLTRDFTTGETQVDHYSVDTPWVGDKQIPESEMNTLGVSLEQALRNAKNDPEAAESDGLNSAYVTLRKPLWPVWENPQYVIGGSAGRDKHIFVDAKTGAVSALEMPAESGSTAGYLVNDYGQLLSMYWADQILGFQLDIGWHMVEVQYELNAPANSRPAGELFAKNVIYLFYVPAEGAVTSDYIVRGMRDLVHGSINDLTTEAEVTTTPWTGGKVIGPDAIDEVMSVEDALYAMKMSGVTDADTPYVTLCWPTDPALEHPQYAFQGDKTRTVYVDAVTGDVMLKP